MPRVLAGLLALLVFAAALWFALRDDERVGPAIASPSAAEDETEASPERPEIEPARESVGGAPAAEPAPVSAPEEPEEPATPSPGKVDRSPEEPFFSELPPDPLQPGDCVLELHLLASVSGAQVASQVELWQLDAPSTQFWAQGDRLRETVEVGKFGHVFEGLPQGRYRTRLLAQRQGAPDPPDFLVGCPRTQITQAVELPRLYHVRLTVYDENGLLVDRATKHGPAVTITDKAPPWVTARQPQNFRGPMTSLSTSISVGSQPVTIEAGPQGFDLGGYLDPTLSLDHERRVSLTWMDRTPVECPLLPHEGGDSYWVGVTLPLAMFAEAIVLPDGRSALEAGAQITTRCHAKLEAELPSQDPWRSLETRVDVHLKGYTPVSFTYRLAGGPVPRVTLEPLSSAGN